ncbi:Zn-ribbon domain-containing OB-fold protein [Pseudoroseomonas cervicalis]|uniref:Zn-ribbon domain-containing OB-fold protein n=1 Tax=Teichococcus cervicalis TaxID=204525 RepID=UPI0022F18300|nr:Zn-ribbon domain-containing OB-fold protein [Pseudoroseomonas cervicalis]WBV42806.1 Zn-ribbon domain-containing OB-fold protein [Pseudoroseomonas cervicalis]
MSERIPPAPVGDPSTQRFWDAARQGRLLIGRNTKTGQTHYPPRPFCPFSDEGEVEWIEVSGEGTVYSFSIMRAKTPYAIAYVELAEGPRMMTNIVGCDFDAVKIGMKVKLAFRDTEGDGPPVPMFTPA